MTLGWRRRMDALTALAFFLLVVWLVPLVLAPEPPNLPALAPAVVWVAAALSIVISSLRLFADDHANGCLEQMLLAEPQPTPVVAGLLTAHGLATLLPLLSAMPLVAAVYGLSAEGLQALALSVLLGVPALSVLAALGAALTLGARGGAILLAVLVLPLSLPVLLFGVRAAQGAAEPAAAGAVLLLGATALVAVALGPWGVTKALEVVLE